MTAVIQIRANPKKTAIMTFRIDENVLNVLRTESDRNQITLNSFVNQILKRYVDWDMFEPKSGYDTYSKANCGRII
jgi:hypothetical protein